MKNSRWVLWFSLFLLPFSLFASERVSPEERLLQATKQGNLSEVEKLLKDGADPEYEDIEGNRAIFLAIDHDQYAIFKRLFREGVSTFSEKNRKGASHFLAEKGDKDLFKILLRQNININEKDPWERTPLHYACKGKSLAMVKFLLKKSALPDPEDIFGNTPLVYAKKEAQAEIADLLKSKGADDTITYKSEDIEMPVPSEEPTPTDNPGYGAEPVSEDPVSEPGSPAVDPQEPIEEQPETICDHMERIFSDPRESTRFNRRDANGETPLFRAIRHNTLDVAKALINRGANLRIHNKRGDTLIHMAVRTGKRETLRFVLANMENYGYMKKLINRKNIHTSTPLHIAAKQGDLYMIKTLLDAGANPHRRNWRFKKAFHLYKKPAGHQLTDEEEKILAAFKACSKSRFTLWVESFDCERD